MEAAKDSNELKNIVTTDDELYHAAVDEKITSTAAKEAKNYTTVLKLGWGITEKKEF